MPLKNFLPTLLLAIRVATAVDQTVKPDLDTRLKLASTTYDRHSILSTDSAWTYDFNAAGPNDAFKPGSVKNANAATFPAMTGVGMTLAQLNLGPCAMLPPHLHPRATNVVVAVQGNTTTYMANENGVRTVQTTLTPGIMTIFPRGALHAMQNNDCTNSVLISALDSEDSGTLNILTGLWTLPADIIRAAFGSPSLDVGDLGKQIPDVGAGSAMGSAECKRRCGIA